MKRTLGVGLTQLLVLALAALVVMAGCAPAGAESGVQPASTSGASLIGPSKPSGATTPLAATAPAPSEAPAASTAADEPAARPKPPKAGDTAFAFVLEDLDGSQVSLGDFRGTNVMLNFWATWCGPCRYEIPHMVKLYGEMQGEDFEILAVNLRETPGQVRAFVSEYDMAFPILLDTQGIVGGAYYVRGIPTSIFIDREGIIKAVHTGTLTESALRQYVSELTQ